MHPVRVDWNGRRGAARSRRGTVLIRFEAGTLALQNCHFLDNEIGLLSAGRPEIRLAVDGGQFGAAPRLDRAQLPHLLEVEVGPIGVCTVMHSGFFNGWRGNR